MDEDKTNLTDSLKKLEGIVNWFETQEDVDVEAGLAKVKEAATLIKGSRTRLAEIENEFHDLEKEISDDIQEEPIAQANATEISENDYQEQDNSPINLNEIPF